MQEITEYKKKLKPAILAEALKDFSKYGIRAVKMDDIAKQLGISKRTLYEVYPAKEDVIVDVVKNILKRRDEYLSAFIEENDNVFDLLLEELKLHINFSANTHSNFFNDILKYPAAQEILADYKNKNEDAVYDFYRKGVLQGYFRDDIDYKVFHLLFSGHMEMLRTDPAYEDLSYQELFINHLSVIIRGICTLKGLERFEGFTNELVKEPFALTDDQGQRYGSIK